MRSFIICSLLLMVILVIMSIKTKEYFSRQQNHFLAIICRIRNEHFMMQTFIPYYLSQGVDKIYLIDDNSDFLYDNNLMKNDKVQLIQGSLARKTGNEMADANHIYQQIRPFTKWVMTIDADEFIYTKKHTTIRNCLETEFKNAHCVFIPWVMFSFNQREKDGNDIIIDYLLRWNHDKKHPHPNKNAKNRCRYEQIECKSIFKSNAYMSLNNPHNPTNPVSKSLNTRESVYNLPHKNRYFSNFREQHINDGFMLCNHYRFSSLEKIKDKCKRTAFNNYNSLEEDSCVENCILSDHPEVYDDYLKQKWLDILGRNNKRL
jgi:hypothetical protein